MAVVVTAKSGYDLGYVWRGLQGQPERTAGGYYLNASLQGEAPGRWHGRGAAALGLTGEVCREPYMAVYAQRHPATGEQLGRRPWPVRDLAGALRAAAGRRAARDGRAAGGAGGRGASPGARACPVHRRDGVVLEVDQRPACLPPGERQAGPPRRRRGRGRVVGRPRARCFRRFCRLPTPPLLDHAQRWAGVTRTGYHGAKVERRRDGPVGRGGDRGLVVAAGHQPRRRSAGSRA